MSAFKPRDPERARQYFEDKLSFTTGPVELYCIEREAERALEQGTLANVKKVARELGSAFDRFSRVRAARLSSPCARSDGSPREGRRRRAGTRPDAVI
jgi:hypothetical protein